MNKLYFSGVSAALFISVVWLLLITIPKSETPVINAEFIAVIFNFCIAFILSFNFFKIKRFNIDTKKLIGIFFVSVGVIVVVNIIFLINSSGYYFLENRTYYIPLFLISLLLFEGLSRDTYLEKFGEKLIADKSSDINWRYFVLSLFIKVFFACFLFDIQVELIQALALTDILNKSNVNWFNTLIQLGLLIDVSIALIGYIFAAKYFKNSIKSFNPYLTGIVVCFLCYPPINDLVSDFVKAPDKFVWTHWLEKNTLLYWFWGCLITVTWTIYFWATISFGNTFSNLTYRRLIHWGPYRYCAHPAYLAKNIYWWLMSVPFVVTTSILDTIIAVLVILFWNGIYYLRAKTEEMHLAQYPAYRQYLKKVPIKCL